MGRPAWKDPWWRNSWRFFRYQLAWRLRDSWYAFWHTFVLGDWCEWKWLDVPDCGCCGWGSPGWVCRKCLRFEADLGIGRYDRPRGPSREIKNFRCEP